MRKIYEIAVIDPSSVSREGMKRVLSRSCCQVVESWRNIEEAIETASAGRDPAAILINCMGQTLPVPELFTRLREKRSAARLIAYGESAEKERVKAAIKAGFDGFLLDSIRVEAFPKAIELIVLGERLFPVFTPEDRIELNRGGPVAEGAVTSLQSLSVAELRVLALLAKACSNKVIALEFGLSESTVKVHVKSILRKTGARNRTDAALLSRDVGAKAYLERVASEGAPDRRKSVPAPQAAKPEGLRLLEPLAHGLNGYRAFRT